MTRGVYTTLEKGTYDLGEENICKMKGIYDQGCGGPQLGGGLPSGPARARVRVYTTSIGRKTYTSHISGKYYQYTKKKRVYVTRGAAGRSLEEGCRVAQRVRERLFEPDQTTFFRSSICPGARRNPAACCCTDQENGK